MDEMLKITVDKAGITRVWRNGVEIKHLQKVCFSAEPGQTPKIDVQMLVLEDKDAANDFAFKLGKALAQATAQSTEQKAIRF